MSELIVDSSVVAKWVLLESDSADAQLLLSDAAVQGGVLVILDLALVEVTNAIWKRHLRKFTSLDETRRLLEGLLRLPVRIEPARGLLAAALEIACRHGRAVYDALFVALVQHTGLQGVTADEPLYKAVHDKFPQVVLLRNWRPAVSL